MPRAKTNKVAGASSTLSTSTSKNGKSAQGSRSSAVPPSGTSSPGTSRAPTPSEDGAIDGDLDGEAADGYDTEQEALDLEARRAKWTSKNYDHYEAPTLARDATGTVIRNAYGAPMHEFICKTTQEAFHRPSTDTGTSNLLKHAQNCGTVSQMANLAKFLAGSTYSRERLRWLILVWIIRCNLPFSIVNSVFFQNIIFLFNPNAEIESHTTVGRDIERLFGLAQRKLIEMFGVSTNFRVCGHEV
ncbi:hypothetical protein SISNIDRAFT_481974 [Sistotremastrum niveocremeum HHB9708]|uniref:Uncharacterized protein n=1 Tax=Sistotremastrum niveocremeum HHB9708 TaxID=1314777 RepID=A0A164YLE6_9AGAM|nr:hypothetical protein SISNIDRAFT_481974 [Sistotremastrum niveocremeum HHB9708]